MLLTAILAVGGAPAAPAAAEPTGATISGTVTLPAGAPQEWLADVSVNAFADSGDSAYAEVEADGTYVMTDVVPGTYRVAFSHYEWDSVSGVGVSRLVRQYYENTHDFAAATLVDAVAGENTTGIDAAMAPSGTITGTVTLSPDAPADWLRGVRVSASPVSGNGEWGVGEVNPETGSYRIDGLAAGEYRVEFRGNRYWDDALGEEVLTNLVPAYFGGGDHQTAPSVAVREGATTPGIDATLDLGAALTGTVTLTAGADPAWLARVIIEAVDGRGVPRGNYGSPDPATGRYTVSGLPAGEYRVQFRAGYAPPDGSGSSFPDNLIDQYHPGVDDLADARPVAVTRGQVRTGLDARMQVGGTISGVVSLPTGSPRDWLQGVAVSAAPYAAGGGGWGWAQVDPGTGSYTINRLRAGEYRVEFSAQPYWDDAGEQVWPDLLNSYHGGTSPADAVPVTLSAGKDVRGISATLSRSSTISGRVTLPAGTPPEWIESVRVYARSADDQLSSWASATPQRDTGAYTVRGLRAGDHVVEFAVDPTDTSGINLVPEYYDNQPTAAAATRVHVPAEGLRSGVDATLATGAVVSGTITGIPADAEWANLSVVRHEGADAVPVGGVLLPDGDGVFTVGGLRPGQYYLGLDAGGRDYWQAQYLKTGRDTYQLTVPASGVPRLSLTAAPHDATLSGSVTASGYGADSDGSPVAGVMLYQRVDTGWIRSMWGAEAAPNAKTPYSFDRLTAGTYTVGFEAYGPEAAPTAIDQWWSNKPSLAQADAITLAAGQKRTGIDGAVTPRAPAAPPVFTDVSSQPGSPAYSAFATEIAWMSSQGISTGYDVGGGKKQYRPFGNVTRDAMAAFLYRYAGSPDFTPEPVSPFTDVPTSNTYYKEISWLASTGITTGWDVGGGKREFRPFSPITRDAMAAFLYRFAESPKFTPSASSPFSDVPTTNSFYKEISWLADSGISTGWDVGGKKSFRPFNPITRDAMAAFLYRFDALG
ncbi:S-layer homology domain-containing protein [Microbacterium sp. zg.Y909]|uniref:S-layer homology domain-containing protein n=1 Tax=Microbacterium sp. zg.Y909 TaxID=2969413 RepID=UPI00214B0437|nr:S-layer homology domain-containing protein [Microbacterium sp. zg.Y909]